MLSGEPLQLSDQQVNDVVGDSVGADARHVPSPCRRVRFEFDQPFGGEGGQELDYKEGIARRLLIHQPRERLYEGTLLTNAVGDKLSHIVERQRGEHDVPHHRAGLTDRVQRQHQRMGGADLVVPVGADEQEVPDVGMDDDMLDQFERGCIEPLHVVEKERERMFLARNYTEKGPEHRQEPVFRILGGELRHGRLLADYQFQFGNEIDQELAVRTDRIAERGAPAHDLCLIAAENLADQGLKGLRECRVGMSRLYWSYWPETKMPRDRTIALCKPLTIDDLPMPEWPDTNTNSGVPLATTGRKRGAE